MSPQLEDMPRPLQYSLLTMLFASLAAGVFLFINFRVKFIAAMAADGLLLTAFLAYLHFLAEKQRESRRTLQNLGEAILFFSLGVSVIWTGLLVLFAVKDKGPWLR